MSIQYMFYNRTITKKDILEKTNFKIERHNGSDWIIADEKTNLRIVVSDVINRKTKERYVDYENIHELENHGFKNVECILDELVKKFDLLFYTDNEFEHYCHYPDVDMDILVKEAMLRVGGYDVLDIKKPIILIPNREPI